MQITYTFRIVLLFASFCSFVCPVPAVEDAQKWVAIFEQSYGTEGLYVVEINPGDDAGKSRLNIQKLNAAAQQFKAEFPERKVSWASVEAAGMKPELHEVESEEYQYDEDKQVFVSNLGGFHSAQAGARNLLGMMKTYERRVYDPDNFPRRRWSKIYEDERAPEFLKKEILLREFFLENFSFKEARFARELSDKLSKLEDTVKLYAVLENLKIGDAISLKMLEESDLAFQLPDLPKGAIPELSKVGEPPTLSYYGVTITPNPDSVLLFQEKRAGNVYNSFKDYPPAMALKARFMKAQDAINLLNQAIELWPEVPGLRLERMTQLARLKRFDSWTVDLDYILKNFPSAPQLLEIRATAQLGGVAPNPQSQAAFALILADIRPDLLPNQIYALTKLVEAGNFDDAQTVYDRLVYANPAWRLELESPSVIKEELESENSGVEQD